MKKLWWAIIGLVIVVIGVIIWHRAIVGYFYFVYLQQTGILGYRQSLHVDNLQVATYRSIISDQEIPAAKNELLVQLSSASKITDILDIAKEYNAEIIERISRFEPIFRLRTPAGIPLEQIWSQINQDPRVAKSELNTTFYFTYIPDDPGLSEKWDLKGIDMDKAWDIEPGGSPDVWVAVIDSGVNRSHPDLKDSLAKIDGKEMGRDFVEGGDGLGGMGKGEEGYDIDLDGKIEGPNDHGTHVAGIAAETGDNGLGYAGVAYKTSILPLRVSPDGSEGASTSSIIEALEYTAIQSNVKVVNLSMAVSSEQVHSANLKLLQKAINQVVAQDIIVVVAAGNDDSSVEYYPAAFPNIVAVAALDINNKKTHYSNYGEWIDISAYGDWITSTSIENSYTAKSGTSMAAPAVAGVIALLRSYQPALSNEEAIELILDNAEEIDSSNASIYHGKLGRGLVNPYLALQRLTSTEGGVEKGSDTLPPNLQLKLNLRELILQLQYSLIQQWWEEQCDSSKLIDLEIREQCRNFIQRCWNRYCRTPQSKMFVVICQAIQDKLVEIEKITAEMEDEDNNTSLLTDDNTSLLYFGSTGGEAREYLGH